MTIALAIRDAVLFALIGSGGYDFLSIKHPAVIIFWLTHISTSHKILLNAFFFQLRNILKFECEKHYAYTYLRDDATDELFNLWFTILDDTLVSFFLFEFKQIKYK
jgi:hypothetical protein